MIETKSYVQMVIYDGVCIKIEIFYHIAQPKLDTNNNYIKKYKLIISNNQVELCLVYFNILIIFN